MSSSGQPHGSILQPTLVRLLLVPCCSFAVGISANAHPITLILLAVLLVFMGGTIWALISIGFIEGFILVDSRLRPELYTHEHAQQQPPTSEQGLQMMRADTSGAA